MALSDFSRLYDLIVGSTIIQLDIFINDFDEVKNYIKSYVDKIWKDKLYSSHLNYVERNTLC